MGLCPLKCSTTHLLRTTLENLDIFDVNDLINDIIKIKLKKVMEKVSVIIRKGSKDLNLQTPISELYNTENEPLEVIIDGRHYINRI